VGESILSKFIENNYMAQRRMFSLKIVDSDAFMDMGQGSQLLYFHLSMRADDEGFIGNPKKIMRMIGSSDDDMRVLISKRFVLGFESGIIVIKHWKIHNYIQNDRYSQSQYIDEKKSLITKENGAYTECIQNVSILDTQVRLELGKDRRVNTTGTLSTKIPDSKKKNTKETKIQDTWEKEDKIKWRDDTVAKGRHGKLMIDYFIIKEMKFPTKLSANQAFKRFVKVAKDITEAYPDDQMLAKGLKRLKAEHKPEMWTLDTLIKILPTL